jgi:hypothetical protein
MPHKPVVFIPGFPASELVRRDSGRTVFPPSGKNLLSPGKRQALVDLLTRPDPPPHELVAGEPIRRVLPIAKQAESLYDILRMKHGYTIDSGDNFRAIGWDWRFAVDDAVVQGAIRDAIVTLANRNGRKVVVIVHSTGGLVFRRLLESDPSLTSSIEQVLAFGVPWAGNLKAFRYLTHGEAIGLLIAKLSATQTREVMRHAQAAYDLCPPDPAKTALVDRDGARLRLVTGENGDDFGPMVSTSWLPAGAPDLHARAHSADARLGRRTSSIDLPGHAVTPILNIAGWGVVTEVRCVVDQKGKAVFNPEVHGRPAGDEKDGDGTVALKSACWLQGPDVRTLVVPIGVYPTSGFPHPHPRIWDSPPLEPIFREVLDGTAAQPWVWAAADADEAIDRKRDITIRIVASDSDGAPLPGAHATLRIAGGATRVDLAGRTRAAVVVKRGRMHPNAAPDMYRFTIDVEWTGGKKELPVLVRV